MNKGAIYPRDKLNSYVRARVLRYYLFSIATFSFETRLRLFLGKKGFIFSFLDCEVTECKQIRKKGPTRRIDGNA